MNRIFLVLAIAVSLQPEAVLSASPFDGEWKGTSRATHGCRVEEMTLSITDGKITGERVVPGMGPAKLAGRVTTDGTLTGASGRLKGNASGDAAEVIFHTDSKECGDVNFLLQKVK